jgi:hypothetical protein
MKGAIVHHLGFFDSRILGGSMIGIVAGIIYPPTSPEGYHGSIDHVVLDSVTLTSNTIGGWANSGLVVGHLVHAPFRISNIQVSGITQLSGGNALGVILGRGETVIDGVNQGNVWLDSIAVGPDVEVTGGAFASGMVAMGLEGDAITNSYSLAHVSSDNINKGAGIIGTVRDDSSKGSPELIANTYFAGTLNNAGVLVGSAYRSGQSIAVHTVTLDSFTQPLDGSGRMVSSSNASFTNEQLRDSENDWFILWRERFSPPWFLSNGSYPQLTAP